MTSFWPSKRQQKKEFAVRLQRDATANFHPQLRGLADVCVQQSHNLQASAALTGIGA